MEKEKREELTPKESIENVFDREDDEENEGYELDEEMRALLEESLDRIQEGEVIPGKVVQISKEYVMVDIGYKSEGQIPIEEFQDQEGNLTVKVGDEVEVLLEAKEDEEGEIILSKEKAAKIKVWDEILKVYKEGGLIRGKIISRVKGGYIVDIGVQAFLPGSQVDLKPVKNMDELIGQEFDFRVLKCNKQRSNIVLSRRVILEEERAKMRKETLKKLDDGVVLEGTVKNITEYGVFVDLGGVDGLLHITDMSWGRVNHPSEKYSIGDPITVKVLHFDREKERVSLGLKQLQPDPWLNVEEKYPVGARAKGKVVSLADYGAFVELEEGIEGLIHVSEMSWTKKIKHPSQVVSIGDIVDVVVLKVDIPNRRISLGMKQVDPNPWDVLEQKYPVGTIIEGKIKNITDFGIFVGIDEGIDGLIHISDLSWTKRPKHPSELYKKGDVVKAVVLNIDRENERFSLGIKQLEPDPWETIAERYPVGSKVEGIITNVTDFGLFVQLEEGIEGLVHVSEVSKEKIKTPVGQFKVGEPITTKVININVQEKKIGLSIRRLEEDEEKDIVTEYQAKQETSRDGVSLGQLLKETWENKTKIVTED